MWRRKRWVAPVPDEAEREQARKAVADSVDRLGETLQRDAEVERHARLMERIARENHLGPSVASALGVHT